jgi:very-short-patch-repair endonuclease
MSELTKIPENVWTFLNKASELAGRMETDRFGQEMHSNIVDREVSSPIEQLFHIALHLWQKHLYIPDPQPEHDHHGVLKLSGGLLINHQAKIGKYKVDFLIENVPYSSHDKSRVLLVELDGHDFHDRDKHQRSYEKARDRFLLQQGYSVVHYTGSDVVADPLKVAHEVLTMVGCIGDWDRDYVATNPFGLE